MTANRCIESNPDLHPYVVEAGYHVIAGNTYMKSEEVAYLLSLENPRKCLNDYVLSKKYLSSINSDCDFRFEFSKKYSSPLFRRFIKFIFLLLYFIFASTAIAPIFFFPKPAILLFLTLPGFGYPALFFLNLFIQINRGEELVNNQKRHIKKVVLPKIKVSSHTKRNLY